MVERIFANKVGFVIMLSMFSFAFIFLVSRSPITYDDVVASGVSGWRIVGLTLEALDKVQSILVSIYSFYANFIVKVLDLISGLLSFFGL